MAWNPGDARKRHRDSFPGLFSEPRDSLALVLLYQTVMYNVGTQNPTRERKYQPLGAFPAVLHLSRNDRRKPFAGG